MFLSGEMSRGVFAARDLGAASNGCRAVPFGRRRRRLLLQAIKKNVKRFLVSTLSQLRRIQLVALLIKAA